MTPEHFAPWEWQPVVNMPAGCNEVLVKEAYGNISGLCSCDYWWLKQEKRDKYISFRFA